MPHELGASGYATRFPPLPAVCFPMSAQEKKVPEGGGQERERTRLRKPGLTQSWYRFCILSLSRRGKKIEVELKGHITPSWKEV